MKINESDFRIWEMTGDDCAIYQNGETFRLAQVDGIKTTISKIQALQLIDLLKLFPVKCPPFRNATTWRLENTEK